MSLEVAEIEEIEVETIKYTTVRACVRACVC